MRKYGGGVLVLLLSASLLMLRSFPAFGEYQSKGKRDPFVPLITLDGQRVHPPGFDEEVDAGITDLILQGIVFDTRADSYAIINGRIVRSNEEVEGMRVVRIEPTTVTILVGGERHQLSLSQPKQEKGIE